ncbi:MAG TPA: GNAT family acetyltransferase, partial [Desulfosporosinus sp.]|nr:GNAT family acetyltransferase [Desulfosporosinus sp.]
MKKIFLVEPQERYAKGLEKMVNEYREYGEKEYFDMYKEAVNDFNGYVSKLNDNAKGIGLLEWGVPQCTYWLTNMEDDILGIVRIRTSLNNEFVRN